MIIGFFILGFVVFQGVIILIIVFFLRMALQKNLVEFAIHQFETMFGHTLDPDLDEIEVITFSPLKRSLQDRLQQAANKKLGKNVKLSIRQDRNIKGGLIIKCGKKSIDTSLLNRLKESGWAK